MRCKLIVLTAALAVLVSGGGTSTAQAHLVAKPRGDSLKARLASQTENLRHAEYVCRKGARAHQYWACKAVPWLASERKETHNALYPIVPSHVRTTGNACLDVIIDRETAGTWNHTIYNYSGSDAYGLPQALPGDKMASAGADWRTNPLTQIRWMWGYVNGRYGGPCQALAFHNANGWY